MKKKNAFYFALSGMLLLGVFGLYTKKTGNTADLYFSGEPIAKTVIKTATEEDRAQRAATWAADALFGFLVPEGE